jgi:integrase
METVQRRTIAALLKRVKEKSGPLAANRVRAALSALWTWSLRTGRIDSDSNPVSFTLRQAEKPRERTLTDDELKAIWKATGGEDDYDRIVRLCLLTGCRREEIGRLRWDEIEKDGLVTRRQAHEGRDKGGTTHKRGRGQ